MRLLSVILIAAGLSGLPAFAQTGPGESPLPARRVIVAHDTDLPGNDLKSIFDTTLDACSRACLSDSACHAFTFNSRAGSCFPKSAASTPAPYAGAISATVVDTPKAAQATALARKAELTFLGPDDFRAALKQAATLGHRYPANGRTAGQLVVAAVNAMDQQNPVRAAQLEGAAVTVTDAPRDWVDFARFLMRAADPKLVNDPVTLHDAALSASVNGYLRASIPQQRADALAAMATALEAAQRGHDMIPALDLAQKLAPRKQTAAALDKAVGQYGFRIIDRTVESDSATPRICATFSEPLVAAGLDYAPYVKLPDPGLSVQASGNQICVSGLDHGKRYSMTFRAGLPAASGEVLRKAVEVAQYVRDRSPAVRFPGRAYVLPKASQVAIPVDTVNVKTIDLKLRRISGRNILRAIQRDYFGRAIAPYDQQTVSDQIGAEVWKGHADVAMVANKDVLTRLPLDKVMAKLPVGVYALDASVPGADPNNNPSATQWFVISDLGLTGLSGVDGLHVMVRSLSTTKALPGLTVTLLSQANAVLGTATTDAEGNANFPSGLTQGTSGAAPGLVTVSEPGKDFGFLSLTDPPFDLSDRGVAGHEPAPPVDVFVTTDRGAYRAGEVVHVTALTRDGKGAAIDGLPLTAKLTRPDGVEYSRMVVQDAGAGGHSFDLPIAASAPRGPWKLDIYADPKAAPLATAHFLVADFLPERIDFALSLPAAPIHLGDAPALTIAAKYLFGTPGADLAVEGEVKLSGVDTMDAYPGFNFGRHDAPFTTKVKPLPASLRTDAKGDLTLTATLPSVPDPGRPLQMTAVVRVSEGSGRPVERQITRALAPSAPVIGIKPGFKDVAAQNAPARFDLIAVGPDGKRTGMKVHWVLNKVETRYQWYQSYGNWKWMPMTTRSRVAKGDATLAATGTASVSAPVEWGEYELKVTGDAGGYASSSVDFYAGWYAPPAGSATPDTLQMSLDKPSYQPGETAIVRLMSRAAGTAMISVLSNRVISRQVAEVKAGDNVIPVKVTKDWGAGAYVTVSVVRPMDEAAGRNPARALGLAYAKVDSGDRQLQASIVTAPDAAPRGPMDVAVKVAGVKPGETAYATIAAVDVGILNLTGFKAPDPSDHYFGQRKLGVGIRDVYGRLIDGLNGAMGTVRSGGDAAMGARMQSPPPTQKLVAFYSGVVTVGADGLAHAHFDLPAFNGTVRVMAVVWSKSGVGQASTDVLVRDPVVVTASLPRFLSPGDKSRLLLEIVHAKGPTGHVALSVSAPGLTLGQVPDGFDLTEHGKKTISIPITANSAGTETIQVDLTTPDGRRLTKQLILPVEVLDPAVTRTSRFDLAAGKDFTLSGDAFAGLIPGSGQATLTVGPIARFDAPALLASLNRYPYGCTEQITSKALPLLYFADVAKAMGLGTVADLDKRVHAAITAVLMNQSSSGSFGLWSPGSGDLWLDAYVTDFLSRARAQGMKVPQTAFRMALDTLRNQINAAPDFRRDGGPYAYALMVLAREGAAAMGDLRYYADARAAAFDTPLAAAQLGAALASYGDKRRAANMFAQADRLMQAEMAQGGYDGLRSDYGTYRRDAAAVLALAAEAGTPLAHRVSLEETVAKAAGSGEMTTQEETWTLLATHALIDRAGVTGFTLNGAPVIGPLVRVLDAQTARDRTLDVHNGSDAAAGLTVTTYGVPENPGPAGGNGYAIRRSYYRLDGRPADIASVKEGTRLVAVLEVTPFHKGGARLMVQDPLPAGFEIDNPNLLSSGSLQNFDWLKTDPDVAHAEFRHDRFLAAVTHSGTDPFRLAYVVRAITPGSYHHPAASVADMYRPGDRARGATGTVTVTP